MKQEFPLEDGNTEAMDKIKATLTTLDVSDYDHDRFGEIKVTHLILDDDCNLREVVPQ